MHVKLVQVVDRKWERILSCLCQFRHFDELNIDVPNGAKGMPTKSLSISGDLKKQLAFSPNKINIEFQNSEINRHCCERVVDVLSALCAVQDLGLAGASTTASAHFISKYMRYMNKELLSSLQRIELPSGVVPEKHVDLLLQALAECIHLRELHIRLSELDAASLISLRDLLMKLKMLDHLHLNERHFRYSEIGKLLKVIQQTLNSVPADNLGVQSKFKILPQGEIAATLVVPFD
jgi:hypothetical protein